MITAVIGTISCSSDGCDDLEPLDRGQHRDRRRDHAVAEEQRGAEDARAPPARASSARPPGAPLRRISVISAMMPPSPSLSARITSST